MRVSSHGDHLLRLTRYVAFNCYLVREADGFTLVDTGLSGSAPEIVRAAQAYGAPIRRILLTHAHVDHVGSLDALRALLPDAELAVSAREARLLAGDHHLDADEPQVPLRGGYPVVATRPDRLLQHGDRIGSLEAIASPGHTPGHLAFLDVRDRTLIAGDAYSTMAGVVTGGSLRLLFPFQAMATWHRPTSLQSAEALRDLRASRLATGHGRVLEAPLPAMQRAIDEAKRALGEAARVGQEAG